MLWHPTNCLCLPIYGSGLASYISLYFYLLGQCVTNQLAGNVESEHRSFLYPSRVLIIWIKFDFFAKSWPHDKTIVLEKPDSMIIV